MKKAKTEAGSLRPISSKITPAKERKREKERARRKKGGEEYFWPKKKKQKKLFDGRALLGGNVFINPARYTCTLYCSLKIFFLPRHQHTQTSNLFFGFVFFFTHRIMLFRKLPSMATVVHKYCFHTGESTKFF